MAFSLFCSRLICRGDCSELRVGGKQAGEAGRLGVLPSPSLPSDSLWSPHSDGPQRWLPLLLPPALGRSWLPAVCVSLVSSLALSTVGGNAHGFMQTSDQTSLGVSPSSFPSTRQTRQPPAWPHTVPSTIPAETRTQTKPRPHSPPGSKVGIPPSQVQTLSGRTNAFSLLPG